VRQDRPRHMPSMSRRLTERESFLAGPERAARAPANELGMPGLTKLAVAAYEWRVPAPPGGRAGTRGVRTGRPSR
jgi:hypothetical protein